MKSVKPGRGPSAMSAFGSIIAVIFGIIWTAGAASMGAPSIMPLFGVLFILLGIGSAVYNFKNATGKNRYSSFDITDEHEEADPLNERFGQKAENSTDEASARMNSEGGTSTAFCPYCGADAEGDYEFCRKCGKKLPK